MRCPSCCAELEIADREGIKILCCPRCAGIWLNAGILEKIVGRTLDADKQITDRPPAKGEQSWSVRRSPPFPGWGKVKLICVGTLAAICVLLVALFGS